MIPAISVVIPTLNEEQYLPLSLASLQKQTFTDFEIIISDGGSTDTTTTIAKDYGARVIQNHKGRVTVQRQQGMMAAKGAIIVCADADTYYPPNHLAVIYQVLTTHPEAVAITGKATLLDGPWWGIYFWRGYFRFIEIVYTLTGTVLYGFAFNLSFRKDIFLSLGGYNTNLDFGGDELDVLRRLKRKGKILFSPQLSPKTSSRRYHDGFFPLVFKHVIYYYLLNYATARLFGKSIIKTKPVR